MHCFTCVQKRFGTLDTHQNLSLALGQNAPCMVHTLIWSFRLFPTARRKALLKPTLGFLLLSGWGSVYVYFHPRKSCSLPVPTSLPHSLSLLFFMCLLFVLSLSLPPSLTLYHSFSLCVCCLLLFPLSLSLFTYLSRLATSELLWSVPQLPLHS